MEKASEGGFSPGRSMCNPVCSVVNSCELLNINGGIGHFALPYAYDNVGVWTIWVITGRGYSVGGVTITVTRSGWRSEAFKHPANDAKYTIDIQKNERTVRLLSIVITINVFFIYIYMKKMVCDKRSGFFLIGTSTALPIMPVIFPNPSSSPPHGYP
jgi:hypothetical protein